MKFFKHFTDAHEGRSMMALMNEFGVAGYGAFFILTEICAKKLEKETDETFTEDHFKFILNERLVRDKLRMNSTKVQLFLNLCSTLDLLIFSKVEDEFHLYFPKLLESMDRDSKRARTERDTAAPKKKNKIKNKEEDKDKEEVAPKAPPTDPFFRQKFDNKKLPKVAEIWNQHCGPLTKLVMTTQAWNRRCDEVMGLYSDDQIETAVRSMAENKFLTGGSKSKWKATFSWLIKDNGDNIAKVLNGDYDNEQSVSAMLAGMRELVGEAS